MELIVESFLQYFKNSLNTRLSIVYIETWKELNKVPGFGKLPNINQALNDFSEYVGTRLYQVRVWLESNPRGAIPEK